MAIIKHLPYLQILKYRTRGKMITLLLWVLVRELIEIWFNENRGTCNMDDNDFSGMTIMDPFLLLVEGTINNFNIPLRGWDVRLQS